MIRSLRLLVIAPFLLAVGCTGVIVQDDPGPRGSYFDGDLDYAARKGAIVTQVAGNPFGGSKQQFDAAVLRLMKGQNRGVPVDFVAQASDRTDPLYKVVVAFDLPPAVSPGQMCKKPAGLPSQSQARVLKMAIAFCIGDEAKSDTQGRASEVTGASDPKFAALVRGVTQAMIPEGDNLEQGEGGGVVP